MALKPLSLRAYAAHRKGLGLPGGSLQAVQRAISGARLVDSVTVVDGVKKIADPEAADREWAANTDLSKAPGWVKDADGDREHGDEDASPLATASAREKHWKAELAELTYRQKAGELVDAGEVQAEITATFSTVRTNLLGVPNKVKQAHPDLELAVLATIDDAIREALEELATKESEGHSRESDGNSSEPNGQGA
jgi:phage terminase Nu1 subunit (DNA packaging protein)